MMRDKTLLGHRLTQILSILCATMGMASMTDQASADRPSPFYRGIERLAVQCRVTTALDLNRLELQARLCALAKAILEAREAEAKGRPVVALEAVDPRLTDVGTLTVLLHGSVRPAAEVAPDLEGMLLALSLGLYRHLDRPAQNLFPAAPEVVFAKDAAALQQILSGDAPQVEAALLRMLASAVPKS
jgi:hypothetical protein